ncbi:MAG TPA: class I SAM-dependent methyltransferase [Solirubrobacterales bacterium]|nr:class I SAM-dependent methyltransferase [Solirubrobacterales bacterium]
MDWGQGQYELVAEQLLPAAVVVVDIADPLGDETVVDVGCGTGNGALTAAERGATVIGVDPAARLLEVASAAADERDLDAEFVLGEAESMPVSNAEADVVLSVFGVIFAADPKAAAAEMARVLAPHGRMLVAAWIPGGAVSKAVRLARETVAEALGEPAPAPPFPWHEQPALSDLFGAHGFEVSIEEHGISITARSPEEFVDRESQSHPVAVAARPAVERAGREEELRRGLLEIYREANEDPAAFKVTSRYVVAKIDPSP